MSHGITERDQMAYVGEAPWHKLGVALTGDEPIDEWINRIAPWRILRSKVRYAINSEGTQIRTINDQHVLLRSDNFDPLGIVSDGYKVVQPKQVFDFFRELVDGAGFKMETAGTLFGGRRYWAMASIGDSALIVPGDRVGGYLLLCTSADGTLATTGKFTSVRVVCNNTLGMSLHDGDTAHKVSHRTVFNPVAMKERLGLAHEAFDQFAANMRRLSDKQVSMARAERLAFELLKPAKADTTLEVIEKVSDSKAYKSILALFDGGGKGSKLDGVAGTAWGFLNAVTEYADYHVRAQSEENRFNSAVLGSGEALKQDALALLLD